MLRKCKVGKDSRPALFHGWFQFGEATEGMMGMAIVEYEDGTTDYFAPGLIKFDAPQLNEQIKNTSNDNILKFEGILYEWFNTCSIYANKWQVHELAGRLNKVVGTPSEERPCSSWAKGDGCGSGGRCGETPCIF